MVFMSYDFSKIKKRAKEIEEWFKGEAALLRTGRATPALIENVKVDYYGTKTPLKGLASISVSDARTLLVRPWDTDSVMPIEQAVNASELGIRAVPDKDVIRIIFPELTEERRKSLLKLLNEKLEEAKISLRREREEVWRDVQDKEREGEISEDDKYRHKDELQKIIDGAGENLQDIAGKKEAEIAG